MLALACAVSKGRAGPDWTQGPAFGARSGREIFTTAAVGV